MRNKRKVLLRIHKFFRQLEEKERQNIRKRKRYYANSRWFYSNILDNVSSDECHFIRSLCLSTPRSLFFAYDFHRFVAAIFQLMTRKVIYLVAAKFLFDWKARRPLPPVSLALRDAGVTKKSISWDIRAGNPRSIVFFSTGVRVCLYGLGLANVRVRPAAGIETVCLARPRREVVYISASAGDPYCHFIQTWSRTNTKIRTWLQCIRVACSIFSRGDWWNEARYDAGGTVGGLR